MKIGPIEWNPASILTEDIKNTRFLLTILTNGMIMLIIALIAAFIIFRIEVDEVLFGSFTLVLGYLIGAGQLAMKSYFDSRGTTVSEAYLASTLESPTKPEEGEASAT